MTKEKKENKWQEDPDIQDFLERADAPGTFSEEDDKSFLVAGMSNDKDRDFMKFAEKEKTDEKSIDIMYREFLPITNSRCLVKTFYI